MILIKKMTKTMSLTILYLVLIFGCILMIRDTFWVLLSNLNIIWSLFIFTGAIFCIAVLIILASAMIVAKIHDVREQKRIERG